MKNLLFPRGFHKLGWILFIPALVMGIICYFNLYTFSEVAGIIVHDIVIVGITLGALFIVCSKEKCEDEMTRSIRVSSLLNALYGYSAVLIVTTLLINGIEYIRVMAFNIVLLPMLFVLIFRLEMRRYYKMSVDEE